MGKGMLKEETDYRFIPRIHGKEGDFGFYYAYGLLSLFFIFVLLPHTRGWFMTNGYRWIYIPVVSALISFLATPFLRLLAVRLGILDEPAERKTHEFSTPLLGGLAVYSAFAGAVLVNYLVSWQLKGIALGATIVMILGLVEDTRGLSARLRILGHLGASLIVVAFGVRLSFLPPTYWGDAIEIILTLVWLVGLTNAMNFLDGIDGLATGLGAIAALFMGLVAIQTGQRYMMFLAMSLMGGCIGFLPFNFRPGRPAAIFLGDAGSTFIGFTLASLAVMGEWARGDPVKALSMPILILGIMIFDMTFTTVSRVASGRVKSLREWMEYVGRDHIHHRLQSLGMSKEQTVFFIYLIASSLGLSAVVLKNGRTVDAFLLILQAFNIFFIVAILMLKGEGNRTKNS